jgi:hypothetical protein
MAVQPQSTLAALCIAAAGNTFRFLQCCSADKVPMVLILHWPFAPRLSSTLLSVLSNRAAVGACFVVCGHGGHGKKGMAVASGKGD